MVWKVMQGDVRNKLAELPEKSVQCVVTSPPYWGLRDYGLPPSVWGGDENCEHEWGKQIKERKRGSLHGANAQAGNTLKGVSGTELKQGQFCQKCGAWLGCLGLEPTPEMFVANLVEVFKGVWRVLRDDGVLWLNLGSSYAGSGKAGSNPEHQRRHTQFGQKERKERLGAPMSAKAIGYKPKDLIPIPWLVAIALQKDGWCLRSDIIWHKPNPMPESVTDRPTKAHEYIFLLTKNQKYFYDADAIREPLSEQRAAQAGQHIDPGNIASKRREQIEHDKARGSGGHFDGHKWKMNPLGRNKHSVWTVATQPYPEAHFATFPPRLITPMVLAGTSPKACEKCGAPWERVVEKEKVGYKEYKNRKKVGLCGKDRDDGGLIMSKGHTGRYDVASTTTGWQPTCSCENEGTGRCVVLDPFAGSGTTLHVAEHYGRDSIGIELNPEYVKLIEKRMDNFQQTIFSLGVGV